MDYPRQYEACPLLPMEEIHHFLKSCDSWFSLGQHNIVLMHCEAPPDVSSQLMSPFNSLASQLRYLQYVLKRIDDEQWPPSDKPLTLVCVMMRMIPDFDGKGGGGRTSALIINQAESDVVKIDINCHIQGDIVLECLNLHDDDMAKDDMMYKAMFNTAFIKSNTLVLNCDEIDVLWDIKDQFSKDFKAEHLVKFKKCLAVWSGLYLHHRHHQRRRRRHIFQFHHHHQCPPPPPPFPPPPINKPRVLSRTTAVKSQPAKKLKTLHWVPEIDMSELETLFSASKAKSEATNKPEKVQLIDHNRAYNCEILLSKVKTPLPELMEYVLNLDDSAMDVDQVDNLIKCCPTREEMEIIKGYEGEPKNLGKCEQIFLELMKVPRSEAKLIVYSYKLQFSTQVSDLANSQNDVYLSIEHIRSSVKLRRVMLTILSIGNAFNQGTGAGAAVGFRLDSLLRLNKTRDRSNKTNLICKTNCLNFWIFHFSKELGSLEPASKIRLKILAEEMCMITKGLEKVVIETKLCKTDGNVSKCFRKCLRKFLASAEPDVKSLAALYSVLGKRVDALIIYFGEDPTKCPYEKVVETLRSFVRMFNQSHDENCKQIDAEKETAQKAAEQERLKAGEPDKLEADE
ncbi:unnamed protein product [Lactuca virosa]|uniref:Formin-like protein n=1 Tax=Lactuca virosa TaxID=75947 RepID=A0AAU9N3S9_9ASTR|nr:unnamed protein product [Lactuca virosa]